MKQHFIVRHDEPELRLDDINLNNNKYIIKDFKIISLDS